MFRLPRLRHAIRSFTQTPSFLGKEQAVVPVNKARFYDLKAIDKVISQDFRSCAALIIKVKDYVVFAHIKNGDMDKTFLGSLKRLKERIPHSLTSTDITTIVFHGNPISNIASQRWEAHINFENAKGMLDTFKQEFNIEEKIPLGCHLIPASVYNKITAHQNGCRLSHTPIFPMVSLSLAFPFLTFSNQRNTREYLWGE